MQRREVILEKLAGARKLYADCKRAAKRLESPGAAEEAAKFYASLRVLEWVLESDKEEACR